jgi:UDP-N-acetyl-D-galactosamine dehydrogenase
MKKIKNSTGENPIIGIIGLGYVGLPLAVEFSKIYQTIGFDINKKRVNQLKKGNDKTNEIEQKYLLQKKLFFTSNSKNLSKCNTYIVTVPTPITKDKKPDLSFLEKASEMVGKHLKKNDVVIFESTVYPGVTEDICLPILEKISNLKLNKDFFGGYSPERINPGDKKHRLKDIKKVTSGSTEESAKYIDHLYKSIIKAGTFRAKNIKTAEAAKVIENTQRDINIALMNEFSMVFNQIGLDTHSILEAARTKWNFLPFEPGLVGGHCIGIDPYYLAYKSILSGHTPEMILSGRKINDSMSLFFSRKIISLMKSKKMKIKMSKILILGFAFKENCPDHRNTKVFDLYNNLSKKGSMVDIYDPLIDFSETKKAYKANFIKKIPKNFYDVIVIAVPHSSFLELGENGFKEYLKTNHLIYDLKNLFKNRNINRL